LLPGDAGLAGEEDIEFTASGLPDPGRRLDIVLLQPQPEVVGEGGRNRLSDGQLRALGDPAGSRRGGDQDQQDDRSNEGTHQVSPFGRGSPASRGHTVSSTGP